MKVQKNLIAVPVYTYVLELDQAEFDIVRKAVGYIPSKKFSTQEEQETLFDVWSALCTCREWNLK